MQPWQQGLTLMWRFLGRGRTRPAAIVLAVTWGTFSMMMLLAFGEGLGRQMDVGMSGLGEKDPVILRAGTTTRPWQGMRPGRQVRLTKEDLDALRRGVPEIDEIAAECITHTADIRWGEHSVTGHVGGVSPCFDTVRSYYPQPRGRFLSDVDETQRRRVIFLGPELKGRLFGDETEAIGETVYVRGVPFRVIGVMIDKHQMGMYEGPDASKAAIPLTTYEAVFGSGDYNFILYTVRPPHATTAIESKVRAILARRQQFDPADESALHFRDNAVNRAETNAMMNGIQFFLGIVGAMTILVAGVGLANMLFVLVHRRTREIGLQMAIGAQRAVITVRVVGEALVLAGVGGYLGIALSWLVTELLHRVPVANQGLQFLGKPTLALPLGAATVVVLIGIACLAGILPARRASRLNPVEALRYE